METKTIRAAITAALFALGTAGVCDAATQYNDGDTISGTITDGITIAAGASVTLNGATISNSSGPTVECLGDATIILDGANFVTNGVSGYPGIYVATGCTLTIREETVGTVSLTAFGGASAAGICAGNKDSGGSQQDHRCTQKECRLYAVSARWENLT